MSKTKPSLKLRVAVLTRDRLRCIWCGRDSADGVKLEVDHVLAEAFGGKTTYENLGTLCNMCNSGKSSDYFGSYLLTTFFKSPDLEKMIEDRNLETGYFNGKYYDGHLHQLRLIFFKPRGGGYWKEIITHEYIISEILLVCKGPEVEIKINEIKDKAILEMKNKIRDYLFEHQGFIEQKHGKLIFRERKLSVKKQKTST